MAIRITILGSSSAVPTATRFTTSQFIEIGHRYLLMDCGEGSMHRMLQYGLPIHKLETIFISHLHSDHILGLPGLLSTYKLQTRTRPLAIYAPEGLRELFNPLLDQSDKLPYSITWHTVDPGRSETILEDDLFTVRTVPLDHTIPTTGYLFRERPRPYNVRKEAIRQFDLSIEQIKDAKAGRPVYDRQGRPLEADRLVIPPPKPASYAFCSDTAYMEALHTHVHEVDVLYHESTYLDEMAALARERGHSTAAEAARVARDAGAGRLILGHFSTRYSDDLRDFEKEAAPIFPQTVAARDGLVIEIQNATSETYLLSEAGAGQSK